MSAKETLGAYSASTANNARMLDSASVARLFVPPPCYKDLLAVRNQLLVGPRGSGKTTLLKMLRIPSVVAWRGNDGDFARENLPFVGIFLPADVSWTGRLNAQAVALPVGQQTSYVKAALSLTLFRAIIDSFLDRTSSNSDQTKELSAAVQVVSMTTHVEVKLCQALAAQWGLEAAMPTLRGLKSAVSAELVALRRALDRARMNDEFAELQHMCARLSAPFVDTVINAADLFDAHTGAREVKWALLVDELEIAPAWLQEELLACLRSTDQRLLFKIAITPCGDGAHHLGGLTQPHRVDDYDEIPLWFSDRGDAARFCDDFWAKLLEVRRLPPVAPRTVFGESLTDDFEPVHGSVSGRYAREGVWARTLTSLAHRDDSFAHYLERRGVRPDDIGAADRSQMDSVIRKVAPIALFREYFLPLKTRSMESQRRRSRKVVSIYSGAKDVFSVTEGNPRWYLTLVGDLLRTWAEQSHSISREQQARAISAFSDRFLSTVAAYPNPDEPGEIALRGRKPLTVTSLIEKIGKAAFSEIVGPKFTDDPRTTIEVDIDDRRLDSLLNIAINAGALVMLKGDNAGHFVSTPYQRFLRLSYNLSPKFNVPLRTGRSRKLSEILGLMTKARDRDDAEQIGLDI